VRQRLRRSFSGKLLTAALALSLGLIVGISAVLLVSRDRQTTGAAVSNADNRAHVVREALQQITAFQASAAADRLAGQSALRSMLAAGPSQDTALRSLLKGSASLIELPRMFIAVVGSDGRVVDTTMPANDPQPDSTLPSIRAALGGARQRGAP